MPSTIISLPRPFLCSITFVLLMVFAGGSVYCQISPAKTAVPDVPLKNSFYYHAATGWVELQTAVVNIKGKSSGFSMKLGGVEVFAGGQGQLTTDSHPIFYIRCNDTGTPALIQKRQELGLADSIVVYRGQNMNTLGLYIFRLDVKKNERQMPYLMTQQGIGYPLDHSIGITIQRVSDTLLSIEPKTDIPAGEYVLSGGFGSEIRYDFSVAPSH